MLNKKPNEETITKYAFEVDRDGMKVLHFGFTDENILKERGYRYVEQGKTDKETIWAFERKYNVKCKYGKWTDAEGREFTGWVVLEKTGKRR